MRPANKRNQPDADDSGRRADAAERARRLARRKADSMPVVEAEDGPRKTRVVDAELVDPAPRGGIPEVFGQWYLLKLIVRRQLASQYAASLLGLAWSYIQPAMRFAVYYTVMGSILRLHAGTPEFAIHLFCGMVMVHYFSETWSSGTRSIWQNRQLILKMRMPREVFPVAAMLVAAYHTLPQLILLTLICLIKGWTITWASAAAGLLGVGILISFSMAMALFFSALNVFYRDFQNIVGTLLQFMHFMVPMMYPFSRVYTAGENHPWLYQLYMANPVAEAVVLMQKFFWWGIIPESDKASSTHLVGHTVPEFPPDMYQRGLIMLVICIVLLLLAQRFFSRAQNKFPERL
jgi:ABC-2 type transport system permease protein